ncbi:hypothetical protein ACQ4PT_005448 [Festuca glaucescens]
MAGSGEKAAGGCGGGGERRKYPILAEDYELYEEIGQGVSAIVYRALCKPLGEIVAVKVLDFERTNSDLNNIMREAQTMILIDHPNVVKALCSFANNQTLWVVMPYMAGGSCLHIMKSVQPNGFEEAVIATVLREVLKGWHLRADIWSFGITALELAHGHAPFSKYPPMKVLLMTLQNAPPGLDYERDKKFSRDEYKRGISSWNFDIDDLKSQASLVSDCEDAISSKDTDISSFYDSDTNLQERAQDGPLFSGGFSMKYDTDIENDVMANDRSAVSSPEQSACLSRNASVRGVPNGVLVNGHVRKRNSMESCDLDLQEKDSDAIPVGGMAPGRLRLW